MFEVWSLNEIPQNASAPNLMTSLMLSCFHFYLFFIETWQLRY